MVNYYVDSVCVTGEQISSPGTCICKARVQRGETAKIADSCGSKIDAKTEI